MSEEEIIKAVHHKIVKFLLTNYSCNDGDNISLELSWDQTDLSVQSVIAAHLKFFISNIIQYMTCYKKKHVLFCPELNGKEDPRMPKTENSPYKMSSVIAYESTPFTAKDFYQLLKDHQSLIPKRSVYHMCIERLMRLDSVKPIAPSDDILPNDDGIPSDAEKEKKSVKKLKQSCD